jgi:[acyl-carrier-protein] S-malonyltransferase
MTQKVAFVFPGQGSQSVGMLGELAERYALVTQTYQEASDALGFDLWEMVANGPDTDLNQTHNTQPALLAAGVAVWRVWQEEEGILPVMMAGHSLGEYSALVGAGAIAFADAIRLVAERGRLMQEAVPEGTGAMAAILGLEDQAVIDVCTQSAGDQVVQAVNFNSPGQVVIAGHREAVARAVDAAKEAGARRAVELPVSVPSHCDLMRPAAEKLAEQLRGVAIQAPSIPVLHNASVTTESDPDIIRQRLVEQLYSPVRWVETIEAMKQQGVEHVVEAGPGKVLTGLMRRIDRQLDASALFDPTSFDKLLEALNG